MLLCFDEIHQENFEREVTMKIKLKDQNWIKMGHGARLCYCVILWYVLSAILVGFFHVPKAIMYFGDAINLWLFLNAIINVKRIGNNEVLLFIGLFSIEAILSGIINCQSILLLLWGVRQNFRFFLFYFSCVVFLKKENYKFLFSIVKVLFWVSLPLSFIEARLVSYPVGTIIGDYVGGIYYGIQGVNAPLNIIMIIYCSKIFIDYYNRKIKFSRLAFVIVGALVMATFAELKVFLVEIVIIGAIVMVRHGVSLKTIILIIIGMVSAGYIVQFFVDINGGGRSYYTKDYLSFSGMIENALRTSGYDGNGDLNRFFAIQTLTEKFFKNNIWGFLMGLGLGNAEYSMSFSFLTSDFYSAYNWLHYQYFSISFVFIEAGLIGIVLYIGIFVSACIQGLKRLEKESDSKTFFSIMCIMMLIMIFYNPSLRNEQCGYILYMILAMPSVYSKTNADYNDESRKTLYTLNRSGC